MEESFLVDCEGIWHFFFFWDEVFFVNMEFPFIKSFHSWHIQNSLFKIKTQNIQHKTSTQNFTQIGYKHIFISKIRIAVFPVITAGLCRMKRELNIFKAI